MSEFKYSPLNEERHEIRLLQILAHHANSPSDEMEALRLTSIDNDSLVSCAIEIVSLDDGPRYNTLSYVWGDEKNKVPVLVNGSVMQITVSLEGALRHLGQETEPFTLWADAICINQQDEVEKSSQVKFMKRIYQLAINVYAWLGPSTEDIDIAIDYLNVLGKDANNAKIQDLSLPDIRSILSDDTREELISIKVSLEELVKRAIFKIPWAHLNCFFENAWFSRVWITQEVAVPSDGAVVIVCGDKRLEWQLLAASRLFISFFVMHFAHDLQGYRESPEKAAFWYQMNRSNVNRVGMILGSRRSYQQEGSRPQESLFDLLVRIHVISKGLIYVGATNPRDRIYALIGIAKDGHMYNYQLDYRKNCAQVYTDATAIMLKQGHFDIMALNQFPKGENFNDEEATLPTWVPDWTSCIQRPCGGYTKDNCHQACGSRAGSVDFKSVDGCDRILLINGCRVDAVTKLGSPWLPTIEDWHDWVFNKERYIHFFDEIASFCKESDQLGCDIYRDPQMREVAHWRIPFGNLARRGLVRCRPSPDGGELLEAYEGIRDGPDEEDSKKGNKIVTYRVAMGDMFKRRPFMSSQGYVGILPSHAEAGDLICVFYGCILPYVLRKRTAGPGYELVGEAYVHGIMNGEFLENDRPTKTFEIY
jgi:hypothetical protein